MLIGSVAAGPRENLGLKYLRLRQQSVLETKNSFFGTKQHTVVSQSVGAVL